MFLRIDVHYVRHVIAFLNNDWNVEYFINPTLYMYLVYGVVSIVGYFMVIIGSFLSFDDFVVYSSLNPYPIILTGRLINIVLSTTSVALVFILSRRFFTFPVAALASAALALNLTHILRTPRTGNEILMVFLVLLFFVLLCRYYDAPKWSRHVLCGFILGLACSTKYNAGIHVIPFILISYLAVGKALPSSCSISQRVVAIVRPSRSVGFLFVLLGFIFGSPYIIINFDAFISDFLEQYSFLHEGYHPAMVKAETGLGLIYYPVSFSSFNNGLIFGVFCGLGILGAIYRAIILKEIRFIILISASLPLYLMLASGVFNKMRFMLPAIPFILILGAWALAETIKVIHHFIKKKAGTSQWILPILTLIVGAIVLLPCGVDTHRQVKSKYGTIDPRCDIVKWLAENLDSDDRIIEFVSPFIMGSPFDIQRVALDRYGMNWSYTDSKLERMKKKLYSTTSLVSVVSSSSSLEDLIVSIKSYDYNYLLVLINLGDVYWLQDLPKYRHVFNECSYWNELLSYLNKLPLKNKMIGHDGKIIMMLYEL